MAAPLLKKRLNTGMWGICTAMAERSAATGPGSMPTMAVSKKQKQENKIQFQPNRIGKMQGALEFDI